MSTVANEVRMGDVVSLPCSCAIGIVKDIKTYGHRTLARVHYIDTSVGMPTDCPDDRCKGEDPHCPIHQRSVDVDELMPLSERDLRFYVSANMLDQTIADAALVPTIKVERSFGSSRFTVTRIRKVDSGTEIRVERITFNEQMVARAKRLLQAGEDLYPLPCTGVTLATPGDEDYEAFNSLFDE